MIKLFTKDEEQQIIAAIRKAEQNTSGEIRVHLEADCKGDILQAAQETFKRLGMTQTAAKNGVLFFIAPERKSYAIIGDSGINDVVPHDFWNSIRDLMRTHFKAGEFVLGVSEGVALVGERLKAYFPYQDDDVNELPDEISYN